MILAEKQPKSEENLFISSLLKADNPFLFLAII